MNSGCCSAAQHSQATGHATVTDVYYAWLFFSLIEHGVFNSVQMVALKKDDTSFLELLSCLVKTQMDTKRKGNFATCRLHAIFQKL